MKAYKVLSIILIPFALASCQLNQTVPPSTSINSSNAIITALPKTPQIRARIARLEKAAAQQFKDPSSVKFKDVDLYKYKNGEEIEYYLCGEENGKNSYGGYNGFNGFYYSEKGDILLLETEQSIAMLCPGKS